MNDRGALKRVSGDRGRWEGFDGNDGGQIGIKDSASAAAITTTMEFIYPFNGNSSHCHVDTVLEGR